MHCLGITETHTLPLQDKKETSSKTIASSSCNNIITQQANVVNNQVNKNSASDSHNSNRSNDISLCMRIISVVSIIVINPIAHTLMGMVKGLELSTGTPILFICELFQSLGDKITSKENSILGCVLSELSIIFGLTAAIILIAPGVAIGLVFGLGAGFMTLPSSIKTSWNYGLCKTISEAFDRYNFNADKLYLSMVSLHLMLAVAGSLT